MTSMTGSTTPSAEPVRTALVVTHGRPEAIGEALERLEQVAREAGVELIYPADEAEKHERQADGDPSRAGIVVVLGGDGTMLRALQRFLGSDIPVVGVNFGRVGFLASVQAEELESGLARVFSGGFRLVQLTTLDVEVQGMKGAAVNDVVVLSSTRGRMVELAWALGGEDMGVQACDGMICATPSGSTAYNLSNGGPVLARGLDAMVVTFIAAHSLHARPIVVPRGVDLQIRNMTLDVDVTVIVDGHPLTDVGHGSPISTRLSEQRSLLATLPESTFFRRYRETFGS
jgi:NAD+ kinase